ncbi:hypothetical protein [Yersinia kristensenii]|uniref:Flagellar hook associated protein lafW n=1 Tax=Yersinia kristensenii TaxID=28152 RepID=A0AB73NHV6_YERKR|nr:hypothetical protein [Yersinia kristensenii]OVZ78892.1 hypothetical protein CBW52_17430 [Yersinia kristensenii]
MQVRSSSVSPGVTAGLAVNKRIGVEQSQQIKPLKPRVTPAAFPESGYLSTEPLRYNVQLNSQLTSLQQADHYLLATERQLSDLQQAISHNPKEIKQQSLKLLSWLEQRGIVSGDTVDRQLNISLEESPKVNFSFKEANKLLLASEDETLLFSLSDVAHSVVAVKLSGQSSAKQKMLQLNKGLGRLGIHGKLDNDGQLAFQIDEKHWQRLSQHLIVRGEGSRYPADKFQSIELQAESILADKLKEIVGQPFMAKEYTEYLQQALTHITGELRQLNKFKNNARERVAGMAGIIQPNSAVFIAERLADKQLSDRPSYAALSHSGQGYLHSAIVKNLFVK